MKQLFKKFKQTQFYLIHKEELITIPLLIIGFALLNWMLSVVFPDSTNFKVMAQLETLVYFSLKIVTIITISWFAFRVSLPPLWRLFRKFYNNEDSLDEVKRMILAIILFCVFILAGAIISRGADRRSDSIRIELKKLLDSQLSIRETSSNRGTHVDMFNKSVGAPLGSYWCASYVSWDLTYLKVKNPNTAWSPAFANPKYVIWTNQNNKAELLLGDVFTEYYARLKRVGHTGFYLWTDVDGFMVTQSGNTSGPGSRNGDRVGRHKVSPILIFAISRFIK